MQATNRRKLKSEPPRPIDPPAGGVCNQEYQSDDSVMEVVDTITSSVICVNGVVYPITDQSQFVSALLEDPR
jgi:hypothetical protein